MVPLSDMPFTNHEITFLATHVRILANKHYRLVLAHLDGMSLEHYL